MAANVLRQDPNISTVKNDANLIWQYKQEEEREDFLIFWLFYFKERILGVSPFIKATKQQFICDK